MRSIGLDIHRDFCEVAIAEGGEVRSPGRIEMSPEALELFAGNKATVGTEIVESTDPAQEGKGQLWSVVDGAGSGAPDRIAGYHMTPMPPLSCPPLSFNVSVISGGYTIHDATP